MSTGLLGRWRRWRDLRRADLDADLLRACRSAARPAGRPLAGASLVLLVAGIGAGLLWARQATLEEVTRGEGSVVPSSRAQVVQSLEGGILAELLVREGDVVERGQTLLRIDDTRSGAALREGVSREQALRAAIARLEAESNGSEPRFPDDLPAELVETERRLHAQRRQTLAQSVGGLARSLALAREELAMTAPLAEQGVVSEVEVLRLEREENEIAAAIADRTNSFRAEAREDLATRRAELAGITEQNTAREDQVRRAVLEAPVRGTVQNLRVTTVGGVIQPGQEIMEVVPLEDQLLVEARIRPSDVAFLRPGLPATVKVSAYDYAIYGGLAGQLERISPDTLEDESRPGERYYRIEVRTAEASLDGPEGRLPIIPGMTVTVEILTGRKTVFDYLVKPLSAVRERALRER